MILVTSLLLSLSPPAPTAGLLAPTPAAAAPTAALQGEELDRAGFLKAFRQALDARADGDIERLIKRNQNIAVVVIIETCEAIALGTNERLEREIAGLIEGWEDAFDSRFAQETYEYFSLMSRQVRAFRSQRQADFGKLKRELDQAIESQNEAQLDQVCAGFESLAEAFGQAGDHYYVSECWWRVAQGHDDAARGGDADYEKAAAAYGKMLEARERIDLKDRFYSVAKLRFDQLSGFLERGKAGEADEGAEGGAAAGPVMRKMGGGVSLGEEVPIDLTFELVEEIEAVMRPGYSLLDLPVVWMALGFGRPGSTADFFTMQGGPQLIRTGSGAEVDIDRDGQGEVPVEVTGNVEPTVLTLGEGDNLRQWAFLSIVLTAQEMFQGIGVPMQAQEASMTLYCAPAGSMVGEVDGVPIRVFDDNMDGRYGSQPAPWNLTGLTEGVSQPYFDTIQIDGADRSVPWSEYIQLDDQWYQLLSDQEGTRVVASKAEVPTGKLKLKSKGVKPLYFVVRGSKTFEHSFYDVMSDGSRGIEVPIGKYSLLCGEVRSGKRKQVLKALIVPGQSMESWTVKAGETTEIEIGEPFDIDFASEDAGSRVTVIGPSVAVVGKAGERYERLWNCVLEPEIFARKVGTKKGGRGTAMDLVNDFDTLTREGFAVGWFPRTTEVKKRTDDEEVELRLEIGKNKMFGKIESSWRPVGN